MKNKLLSLLTVGILSLSTQQVFAEYCEVINSSASLEPISSLNVASLGETMVTGGLKCSGFNLISLGSYAMIRYVAENIPINLTHENGKNIARISIKDKDRGTISTGTDIRKDFLDFSFITGSAEEPVPFYVQVNETTNLKPGVYKASIRLRWYYAIPRLFGLGHHKSPGLNVGFTWPFTELNISKWGSGAPSTINIILTVTEDCNINAQNINFGKAPLVSKFNPVTGTVQITCSAETPYSVGLSDGQNFDQTRRMLNTTGSGYLPYEIYKHTTTNRWGHLGTERWVSADATFNPGIYDGSAAQGYAYTAKIIDDASNPSVVGTYKDTLTIEVAF
ncbi:hypothetical protein A7P53_02105 [Acinetobacter defluvii]|uniref:Csu type fimbrial protein n=1 Tax=Acinetobacter defluvii TaxID=1871111 RepID=UPI0014907C10|nr:spore coat U domain-containing protein [Acinetobacter defluvii]NNP74330.1 hypothetical protein [Acinetobacter defluvii]